MSFEQYRSFMVILLIAFVVIYIKVANPFANTRSKLMGSVEKPEPVVDVIPIGSGKVAGYDYSAVASSDGRIDVYVTLPKPLDFRLVITAAPAPVDVSGLRRLDLEGNFPEEFRVFCEPGREAQALELLDPADMAYLIDFCRGHELRFEQRSFVISQPAKPEAGDPTSVIADAETFITHNRVFWRQFQ